MEFCLTAAEALEQYLTLWDYQNFQRRGEYTHACVMLGQFGVALAQPYYIDLATTLL
jgi:hypothetical protein